MLVPVDDHNVAETVTSRAFADGRNDCIAVIRSHWLEDCKGLFQAGGSVGFPAGQRLRRNPLIGPAQALSGARR